MRAGRLFHRGELQRHGTRRDEAGQIVPEWETIVSRRMRITPKSGNENFGQAGERSAVQFEIELRYESALAELSPAWRIVVGADHYDIKFVNRPHTRFGKLLINAELRSGDDY